MKPNAMRPSMRLDDPEDTEEVVQTQGPSRDATAVPAPGAILLDEQVRAILQEVAIKKKAYRPSLSKFDTHTVTFWKHLIEGQTTDVQFLITRLEVEWNVPKSEDSPFRWNFHLMERWIMAAHQDVGSECRWDQGHMLALGNDILQVCRNHMMVQRNGRVQISKVLENMQTTVHEDDQFMRGWIKTESKLKEEKTTKGNTTQDVSGIQCYTCQGWGHRAKECQTDGGAAARAHTQARKQGFQGRGSGPRTNNSGNRQDSNTQQK
jgi:hypothetical protein